MLNRRTPIISGGLADLDDSGKWLRSVKADAVSVDATRHFLQANGLDQLVDGYGLHFYPGEMIELAAAQWPTWPADARTCLAPRLRRPAIGCRPCGQRRDPCLDCYPTSTPMACSSSRWSIPTAR
jgi:hypothetical protein